MAANSLYFRLWGTQTTNIVAWPRVAVCERDHMTIVMKKGVALVPDYSASLSSMPIFDSL